MEEYTALENIHYICIRYADGKEDAYNIDHEDFESEVEAIKEENTIVFAKADGVVIKGRCKE